ncbi:type 1 glutamine amidotransferase [Bacteroidales bacterium]|nr:type 1 glutamine amidotransferase [Bacteroidales bacterium]
MNKKNTILCLQHVDFEGPAFIEKWADNKGFELKKVHLYKGEQLSGISDFDWLIVMGGPMSVNDTDNYSWFDEEFAFVKKAIDDKKTVIGFCLGAQMIAKVLGCKVFKGDVSEIGWFPVNFYPTGNEELDSVLVGEHTVFHWHGETFHMPKDAKHIASSTAYPNQAFSYNEHVYAFQFHMEMTQDSIQTLLTHCKDELVEEAPFVQSAKEIADSKYCAENNALLERFLNQLAANN